MDIQPTEIVVIGSCNVDLISYSDHFPKPGETLCGTKFSVGCGGKGANQCVMAAKLGAQTSMISSVGDDNFGEMFLKKFDEEKINTIIGFARNREDCIFLVMVGCIHIENGMSTGVAQILVNKEGENCIVIVKGANDYLSMEHVTNASQIIKSAKVALFQLEIDFDVTLKALQYCKENDCITIFNPAPAVQNLSTDFLKYTSVLCCNETEAEILTSLPIHSVESCNEAIKKLLSTGPEFVVLTRGAKGAMFVQKDGGDDEEEILQIEPDEMIVPENVVDTTGAGDCFVGSLAYFIAKREDLTFAEKVRRAVNIAAMSVGKPGTQTSYPSFDQLPESLKK